MGEWFTFQTIVAFILGVLLSAMVKGGFSQLKAKV